MRYLLACLLVATACLPSSAQTVRTRNQLPPPLEIPGDPPPVPRDARPQSVVPPVVMPSPSPRAEAMTLDEFARVFQAEPGRARYEVVLVHPCTRRAVKVCFDLPGCPKRVVWRKAKVVFRYGLCKKAVVVTFCRDGSVRVS